MLTQTIIIAIVILFILYFAVNMWYSIGDRRINEPWLVETTHNMNGNPKTIPSSMLPRSNDAKFGVEFTYSAYLYVENWPKVDTIVFYKGESTSESAIPLLQAPGVWLNGNKNSIRVHMNTYKNFNVDVVGGDLKPYVEIDNIPVKNWFHLTIMLVNNNIDVFINGRLRTRLPLDSPAKQNYGNLYLAPNDGFNGFISRFRYFNYALPFWRIEQLVREGASQAPCPVTQLVPPKLANDWWTRKK